MDATGVARRPDAYRPRVDRRLHRRQPAHGRPPQAGRRGALGVRRRRSPSTSPGGTTTGAEEIYRNIRSLAGQEAARRLRRRDGGVRRLHHGDRRRPHRRPRDVPRRLDRRHPAIPAASSDLLGKLGVKVEDIKSTPAQGGAERLRPTPPEARAALQTVVNDTYDWFKRSRRRRGAATTDASSPTWPTAASSPAARR